MSVSTARAAAGGGDVRGPVERTRKLDMAGNTVQRRQGGHVVSEAPELRSSRTMSFRQAAGMFNIG